jgi:hypothetical protein
VKRPQRAGRRKFIQTGLSAMTKIASLLTLLATVIVCSLSAAPAFAQRDRVFVASYGSDGNPCTFGSPCKTFQYAVSVVATDGEVTAIDSAGFGPVYITKSVTITSPAGVEAGIAAPSDGVAINIEAPGSSVVLSGLTINGADVGGIGIEATAANLEVVNCVVRGFTSNGTGTGIAIYPAGAMNFLISNTIVADNAFGIYYLFDESAAATSVNGVIEHVVATNNALNGITLLSGGAEPSYFTISNSTSSNNTGDGLNIDNSIATRFVVDVDSSNFTNNQGNGINVTGVGSSTVVLLGRSVISGNEKDGITYTNSTIATYGDNRINWNLMNDLSSQLDTTDDTLR